MLDSPPQIDEASGSRIVAMVVSATAALPTLSSGSPARWVQVTAIGNTYFDIGDSTISVAATSLSIMLLANRVYFFNAAGKTHFCAKRLAGVGPVTVSPLENQ